MIQFFLGKCRRATPSACAQLCVEPVFEEYARIELERLSETDPDAFSSIRGPPARSSGRSAHTGEDDHLPYFVCLCSRTVKKDTSKTQSTARAGEKEKEVLGSRTSVVKVKNPEKWLTNTNKNQAGWRYCFIMDTGMCELTNEMEDQIEQWKKNARRVHQRTMVGMKLAKTHGMQYWIPEKKRKTSVCAKPVDATEVSSS